MTPSAHTHILTRTRVQTFAVLNIYALITLYGILTYTINVVNGLSIDMSSLNASSLIVYEFNSPHFALGNASFSVTSALVKAKPSAAACTLDRYVCVCVCCMYVCMCVVVTYIYIYTLSLTHTHTYTHMQQLCTWLHCICEVSLVLTRAEGH